MWRKACVGERESLLSLMLSAFVVWWLGSMLVAALMGLARAEIVATVSASLLVCFYLLRRQRWNARIRADGREVVERFEALLGRPDHRAE